MQYEANDTVKIDKVELIGGEWQTVKSYDATVVSHNRMVKVVCDADEAVSGSYSAVTGSARGANSRRSNKTVKLMLVLTEESHRVARPAATTDYTTISEVQTTLKSDSGSIHSYKLGPKTFIYAENEGGKSTIWEAIQLAAAGDVEDEMTGKLVRSPKEVIDLAPSAGMNGDRLLTSELVIDGAVAAQYKLEQKGGSVGRSAEHVTNDLRVSPASLISRRVREVMTAGVSSARQTMLAAAGKMGSDSSDPVQTVTNELIRQDGAAVPAFQQMMKQYRSLSELSAEDLLHAVLKQAEKDARAQNPELSSATAEIDRLSATVHELASATGTTATPESIAAALKQAVADIRELSASRDSTIQALAAVPDTAALANRQKAARDSLERHQEKLQHIQKQLPGLNQRRSELQQELEEIVEGLEGWKAEKARLEAQEPEVEVPPTPDREYERAAAAAVVMLRYVLDGDEAVEACPICESPVARKDLQASLEFFSAEPSRGEEKKPTAAHAEIREALEEIAAHQQDLSDTQSRLHIVDRDLREHEAAGSRLVDSIEAAEAILAEATPDGGDGDLGELEEELESFDQDLRTARADRDMLTRLLDTISSLQKVRQRHAAAETDKEDFSRLASACRKAVRSMLTDATDKLVKRVNQYMPAGMTFDLVLTDEGREVFRPSVRDGDGPTRSWLCGRERLSVISALSSVFAEELDPDDLKILVPPDVGMSTRKLPETLQALGALPMQVLFLSTNWPDGGRDSIPDGWTVVDLSGDA